MNKELKPCPLCGGKVSKKRNSLGEIFAYADEVVIKCLVCGCSLSIRADTGRSGYADNTRIDERAIKAWNTRANEPNKHEQALLDVLRNKLCNVVDDNDHPADQMDTLAAELERLIPDDDMLHAYEGALEGFVWADRYNSRAKK